MWQNENTEENFPDEQQDKNPEELNEVDRQLPSKMFNVMIIKIFKELRGRLEEESEHIEVFNEELENIKKNKTEVKNTLTEMKNALKGINSRLDNTEEQISELEDGVVEITEAKQINRMKRNENSLRDL